MVFLRFCIHMRTFLCLAVWRFGVQGWEVQGWEVQGWEVQGCNFF